MNYFITVTVIRPNLLHTYSKSAKRQIENPLKALYFHFHPVKHHVQFTKIQISYTVRLSSYLMLCSRRSVLL